MERQNSDDLELLKEATDRITMVKKYMTSAYGGLNTYRWDPGSEEPRLLTMVYSIDSFLTGEALEYIKKLIDILWEVARGICVDAKTPADKYKTYQMKTDCIYKLLDSKEMTVKQP